MFLKPRQFEEYIQEIYATQGYKTEITSYSCDYGVDIFASKGKEKIAIQAKMYGASRKINRKMVMELCGAMNYFDCTKAVIATDGIILPDAIEVAKKLNIEILHINHPQCPNDKIIDQGTTEFERIWETYIIPLQGRTIENTNGKTNTIVNVDWTGIDRITSTGKKQKIEIEIFRYAIEKLLSEGLISRDEINQNYVGRASSGIILILSQAPCFLSTNNPSGLKFNPPSLPASAHSRLRPPL